MVLATSVPKDPAKSQQQVDCERLASQLSELDDLPVACRQYGSVVTDKLKKNTDTAATTTTTTADPFAGMWAGAASKARAARSKGQEHHAQIQRRLTSQGQRRFSKLDK